MVSQERGRPVRRGSWKRARFTLALVGVVWAPCTVAAQQQGTVTSQATQLITLEQNLSVELTMPFDVQTTRFPSPQIALVDPVQPPRRFVITGVGIGSSTLFLWGPSGNPTVVQIQVTAPVSALQNQLNTLFPNAGLVVTASGDAVFVSGSVSDPTIARRAITLVEAGAPGARVWDNIQAPTALQIMLHVRFAEVRRTALDRLGADLFATNVGQLQTVVGDGSQTNVETFSEGLVNLFLIGQEARLDAVINALRSQGEFKSLAEPNLITLDGEEATFLAGGEFPYPAVQTGAGGTGGGAVSIQFREFGVRLHFIPTLTNSGRIRLLVEPEVSSLDFANGITVQGFQLPSLLSRKASTNVELAPGQHLAIAGLLDNNLTEAVDKIPVLGDLPIIGTFFRSRLNQGDRTELLVLVTPYIVEPSDVPPGLPRGEPGTWDWSQYMLPDTGAINRVMPQQRRGGGS